MQCRLIAVWDIGTVVVELSLDRQRCPLQIEYPGEIGGDPLEVARALWRLAQAADELVAYIEPSHRPCGTLLADGRDLAAYLVEMFAC